jgi:hypothetical protein
LISYFIIDRENSKNFLLGIKTALLKENMKDSILNLEKQFQEKLKYKEKLINVNGLANLVLNKRMVGNFEYIKDDKNVLHLTVSAPDVQSYELNVLRLKELCEKKNISFIYAALPSDVKREYVPVSSEIPLFNQYYPDLIKSLKEKGVDCVDANEFFNVSDSVGFKTDVHLKTSTEFKFAEVLANKLIELKIPYSDFDKVYNKENYDILSYDFVGNTARGIGKYFTKGADVFDVYHPKFDTLFAFSSPVSSNSGVYRTGSYKDALLNGYTEGQNISEYTYWVTNYLQWPAPYYTIENKLVDNDTRICIFIDSLSMRAVTFLALGVKHVTVIDPRYGGLEYFYSMIRGGGGMQYNAVITALTSSAGSGSLKVKPMDIALDIPKFENIPIKSRVKAGIGFKDGGMWIDYCNNILTSPKITFQMGEDCSLVGWAFDVDAGKPLKKLYAKVGDAMFECNYGIKRQSVTSVFKNHDLLNTGFSVIIPDKYFNGVSEIGFVMLGADGSYQYEPIIYPVEVKAVKTDPTNATFDTSELENIPIKSRMRTGFGFKDGGMWVDYCNNSLITVPQRIVLRAGENCNLVGWAFDVDAGKPLKKLYAKVGDALFECSYNIERTSVSNAFDNPDLLKTGFSVTIPGKYFNNRVSEIGFVMLGADGSYQYEPVIYPVEVKTQ